MEKTILKFIQNHKISLTANATLNKENNARAITIPDLKIYYRAIVIKTAWYWLNSRHRQRTESKTQTEAHVTSAT